jgi:hypothetical protein
VTRERDGAYWAFFVYEPDSQTRSLVIDQTGALSSLQYGCGEDPASIAVLRDRPFLLPPPASPSPTNPTLVPVPPPTGNAGIRATEIPPAWWMFALAVLLALVARRLTRARR